MTYKKPTVTDLGAASELIRGGGDCCQDIEKLIGNKNGPGSEISSWSEDLEKEVK